MNSHLLMLEHDESYQWLLWRLNFVQTTKNRERRNGLKKKKNTTMCHRTHQAWNIVEE